MELGLIYLDHDRLDEAEKLFARLETFKQAREFRMLGQVGRGIVLALRSKARESNKLLCDVLAPDPNFIGLRQPKGKKGAGDRPKVLTTHLAPLRPFLDHPRGRHWLGQARLYNARNGVPVAATPRYLLTSFPLPGEAKK
jgi:hypothetical protein